MKELEIGDRVMYEGEEYTILFFHKGSGNLPLTAKLRGEDGKEIDVLKSRLDNIKLEMQELGSFLSSVLKGNETSSSIVEDSERYNFLAEKDVEKPSTKLNVANITIDTSGCPLGLEKTATKKRTRKPRKTTNK